MGRGGKTDLLLYFGPAKEIVLSTWEQIFLEIIYSECAIPTNKQTKTPKPLKTNRTPPNDTEVPLYHWKLQMALLCKMWERNLDGWIGFWISNKMAPGGRFSCNESIYNIFSLYCVLKYKLMLQHCPSGACFSSCFHKTWYDQNNWNHQWNKKRWRLDGH